MLPLRIILNFILILLTAFVTSGCASPQASVTFKPPLTDKGELYFYLQPLPQEMQLLSFTISDIAVIPDQGNSISILPSKSVVSGRELVGRQKRLAVQTLPPGRYHGVSLTIEQASIATEEGDMDLLPPTGPVRVELDFSISQGRSQALFLVLSPEYLVSEGYRFTPRFAMGKPFLPPKNYMGLISHSSENIVTVFNKRSMEVIQVIRTGAGPKGMVLDQDEGLVYVALAGDDTIEQISLTTMDIVGRIRLRFGDEPTELALTPDGRTLISANYGSGTVSIIDTRSLSEQERFSFDPDPVWIVAGKDNQKAYVLHALSNTVSVIDLTRRNLFASISFAEAPFRGALSRDGENLYIVSQYSADLLVVDTQSYVVTDRIFIGRGSSSVKVDPKSNLVYVGKTNGEIVIVNLATGMFVDSIPVQQDTRFMAIDGEENVLLAVSETGGTVQKFNLVRKRELALMETEPGSHALVVMGEL